MSDSSGRPASSGGNNGGVGKTPALGSMAGEETAGLREISTVLWQGKWIIGGCTVVLLVLALIYAFLATPIYQANAMIQIDQQQNQPAGPGADVLSMLLPIAAPAQTEIAIMQSRSVLIPTVQKENLDIKIDGGGELYSSPTDGPNVVIDSLTVPPDWMNRQLTLVAKGNDRYVLKSPDGEKVLAGTIGATADAQEAGVKIFVSRLKAPAGKKFQVTRIYDQSAVAALLDNFSAVQKGEDTGIISLTLEGPHPERIKDTLNTLANQYIQQNVYAQAAQAHQSLAFINKQLPKIEEQLNAAQSKLTKYRTLKGVVNLDQQAQSLLSALTNLESQLTQVNLTESAMRQRFTGNYPGIQALQGQKQDLQKQIQTIQAQMGTLPSKEQAYVSLLQKVQVYQQLYTALLSKAQDLQIAQAATVGSARIVDYAVTPIEPVKPRKALIVIVGFILGLFLGILVVFMRHALTRSVRDAAVLEREFGLPVYAVVPHSDRQASLMKKSKSRHGLIPVLANEDSHDPAIEAIRSLRTSIGFALKDEKRKIITIGGCMPGVGKSFLSINLAHVLSSSDKRVLLVDADLRRGHLEKYMGGNKRPGLSQFLVGEFTLQETIQKNSNGANVDFIASGPFPANPYELMAKSEFTEAIEKCGEDYDFVVIDVPPLLSVAEGLIIGRCATANFLAVKAGGQTLQELRIALDRMQQNGVRLEGFVFNNVSRQEATYTYGRYAAGRYYYSRYDAKEE